jgi:alpha-beta hydrolase superfamily lysophospholipase
MRGLAHSRLVWLAGLSLALLTWAGLVSAAEDTPSDRVSFSACDGVELSGTFYPSPKGKKDKDAVVLLLHDFDPRKGGGSHGDFDKLAERLQKEGYSVLSFDFRGFGGSKSVREEFWKFNYNQRGIPKAYHGGVKSAESIDQKDFQLGYYPALINDIAAARAFLDRKNDSRDVNTSNLIVIGAGQGATLGALWMAAEMHRQKDTSPPALIPQAIPLRMDDPEGKDFAAAIWLTVSPNLAGRSVTGAVKSSLVELARDNKVPLAFYFGKSDTSGATLAKNYLDAIGGGKKVELKNTGSKAIPGTELTGSKLLGGRLGTADYIADYLNRVMEDRGSKEWKKRDEEKSRYFWTVNGRPKLPPAKNIGEKVVGPIPGAMIKLGSP